mgnify:CR=1 FL=1|jgi:hypothetical protein
MSSSITNMTYVSTATDVDGVDDSSDSESGKAEATDSEKYAIKRAETGTGTVNEEGAKLPPLGR